MKNILILDTGKEWGGGTNSLLELLKRVDRSRYKFSALYYYNYTRGGFSDIKRELEQLGVDFYQLNQRKQPLWAKVLKEVGRALFFFNGALKRDCIFAIDYVARVKKNAAGITGFLAELNSDLLYMNNQPSSNLEGALAASTTGIPALQHARIEATLKGFEVNAANRFLTKIITVSSDVKEAFVRQGIDPVKCTVVYNGIDARTIAAIPPDEIRTMLKLNPDDIVVGAVGSLIKRKRVDDFIEAISLLKLKTRLPLKALIVGDGPEREILEREVSAKGLVDTVVFAGFQPDAFSYVNAMDIFVLVSEKEGLPRVILEAMLLGKPVVASWVTGSKELVLDGETGILVPLGQPGKLAEALLELVSDPAKRKSLGEKGRARVLDHFSIEQYVSGVEKVFAEVLGE